MQIGIALLCRLSSSRLPGKHLLNIDGRAVLGHIMDRVQRGASGYPLVVATSTDLSDDPLVQYCRRSNYQYYRGPLDDVAGRFLACAGHFGWDYIVRINGDNLFADPHTIKSMLAIAETNSYDFITNVPGRTFPYGIVVEIVRTSFYREIMAGVSDPGHREHVTSLIYEHDTKGKRYVFQNNNFPAWAGVRLALDTREDFNIYCSMMARMSRPQYDYSLDELVHLATTPEQPNPWKGKHGPLLIAEIGGNHEGSFEVAKDLTRKALSTGADFVKYQLYKGGTLFSPVESPDRDKHIARFSLTKEQHLELADMCEKGGAGYLASVWDIEMLDWIDPHLSIYKVGSGDMTAWSMLKQLARRGKPIILSTGLATLDEVLQTVAQIQAVNPRYKQPEWLCLLQCTAMYPLKFEEANLRAMDTLRQTTGLAVGYSDHTEGGLALRTAAAMGAQVLEFHFTDSREGKVFQDHKISLTPEEVILLQKDLAKIKSLQGKSTKVPQPSEIEKDHLTSFRRAVYPRRAIEPGEHIKKDDLIVLRPNYGIDARDMDWVVNAKAQKKLAAFSRISWEDLDIAK